MNDCPNAEIRDRLPDLLHERLEPDVRAQVVAHVERCADCRAELALLKDVHAILVERPRVDVARIVGALPSPAAVRVARLPSRSRRFDWRVAASIAALVVGGVSIGTYASIGRNVHVAAVGFPTATPQAVAARVDSALAHTATGSAVAAAAPTTSGASTGTAAHAAAVTELATGDGLSDMSEGQLEALLSDIERMQPLPPAEPDTIVVTGPDAGTMEEN